MKPIGFLVHGQNYCPNCTKEFLDSEVQDKAFPPIYPDELDGEEFECENCEENT